MSVKGFLKIDGIQCNNSVCDYKNLMIQPQEYEFWINKQCPKCGQVLFTEDDFNLYKLILASISIANKIPYKQKIELPLIKNKVYKPTFKKLQ